MMIRLYVIYPFVKHIWVESALLVKKDVKPFRYEYTFTVMDNIATLINLSHFNIEHDVIIDRYVMIPW